MNLVKTVVGLLCLIALCMGTAFWVLFPQMLWLVESTWAVAGLLLLSWLFLERQKILRFLTQKSTRYGANLALIVILVLGILVFANVLLKDYKWRKDITNSGVNSLSQQTEKIIKDLNKVIKITWFGTMQERDRVDRLLKSFSYDSNKKITYELLDPNRYPTLAKSMGVNKMDSIVITFAEGDGKKITIDGSTEEKITNGLIKLLKNQNQIIYFTTGHGERDLEGNGAESYSALKKEIEKAIYTVKPLNLLTEGKIPSDASVLVIAGPRKEFFPKELVIITEWIKQGGKALIAFDVDVQEAGLPQGAKQLANLIKDYGIEVNDKMLIDPASRAAAVEPQILISMAASHDHVITKDFPTSTLGIAVNFLFPLSTNLKKLDKSPADLHITELVKTTANAWAESDWASIKRGAVKFDQGKDYRGEMALAYAIEKEKAQRLVVFGTSAFAMNGILGSAGNRDLFLNSLNWLASNEEFISIRPKEADNDHLEMNQNWMNFVFLFVVIAMPIAITVTGIWVWYRRRGR